MQKRVLTKVCIDFRFVGEDFQELDKVGVIKSIRWPRYSGEYGATLTYNDDQRRIAISLSFTSSWFPGQINGFDAPTAVHGVGVWSVGWWLFSLRHANFAFISLCVKNHNHGGCTDCTEVL